MAQGEYYLSCSPPHCACMRYVSGFFLTRASAALNAFCMGYRSVDTARNYQNQPAIAKAITDSGVPRDSIFITSKVPGSMSYQETLATNKQTLEELSTTVVDLILVHLANHIMKSLGSKTLCQTQWQAMESCFYAGKARAIGVSHHWYMHLLKLTIKFAIRCIQPKAHGGHPGDCN